MAAYDVWFYSLLICFSLYLSIPRSLSLSTLLKSSHTVLTCKIMHPKLQGAKVSPCSSFHSVKISCSAGKCVFHCWVGTARSHWEAKASRLLPLHFLFRWTTFYPDLQDAQRGIGHSSQRAENKSLCLRVFTMPKPQGQDRVLVLCF